VKFQCSAVLQAQAYYRASGEARSPYWGPSRKGAVDSALDRLGLDFAVFSLSIHRGCGSCFLERKPIFYRLFLLRRGNGRILEGTGWENIMAARWYAPYLIVTNVG